MTALAIPQPQAVGVVDLPSLCERATVWVEQAHDVAEIKDNLNRFAAIDRYMELTGADHRKPVQATMRRFEVRIAEVSPARQGERTDLQPIPHEEEVIPANRLSEFRQMAANPDVVDEVINESTDEDPPSRRKVMKAIKQRRNGAPEPEDEAEPLLAPGEQEAMLDTLRDEYGDDLTAEEIERAVAENVESKRLPEPRPEWQPTKPDLGDGVSHPARYSPELIALFRTLLAEYGIPGDNILDPFAGTGRIHDLQIDGWETVGIEIEPEWAALHPDTLQGSALDLPFDPEIFGAVVTSPTYGNRLADSHNASDPERRRSYTHDLGHELSADNSGSLHWNQSRPGREAAGSGRYRAFHESAWAEATRVLAPMGLFILNCCDHVRAGLVQPVTAWHCWALGQLGLIYIESRSVPTRKLRQGANGDLREQEQVHVFRKPS